ncbi:patatin-like phospholipase family protein [Rhodoferax sp.]|uniref:patatin-like phospholipase family protein n=1 Tax=Rhodoferax sp. TaxID=50421 RepID=UPI00283BF57E|nr:patatin-like phospholipase family protein [Rhodoferax sp.]MDR3368398.1 phospholipase [Rhodoferax sp.]
MKALRLYAGPKALAHLSRQGLHSRDISTIPAAAGGPKGLILGPLDQFIFGRWLPQSNQPVHLVGASIGAWRMATACLNDPVQAFMQLEHDYIQQNYALLPGEKRPAAARVSALFGENLQAFYGGRVAEVLQHPRYRLHVLTSHGRGPLAREHGWRTALGYGGAFLSNLVSRQALGASLERVVFSSSAPASDGSTGPITPLPFDPADYPTRQVGLTEANFLPAMQASCSIPFVLQAVHDIAGAPAGAYWDGGVTDYHLHLDWLKTSDAAQNIATIPFHIRATSQNLLQNQPAVVLYPHFQKSVVPGWLDKHLRWRHHATPFLDNLLLLAPSPDWVKTLPNGKLPDRTDFLHYGADLAGRVNAWKTGVAASEQLAAEFDAWLQRPDMGLVQPL